MLFQEENIFYDEYSMYGFDIINESSFLEEIFINLKVVLSNFKNYDFYIFSSHNTNHLPCSLLKNGNKILIYLSEEQNQPLPQLVIDNYKFIFKSHLDKNINPHNNLYFLPLGYTKYIPKLPIKKITDRKYNIFFSGNLNNNRIEFYNEVTKDYYKDNNYINFTDGFQKGLSPSEYADILYDSKIVLSPKGFTTPECFRTYEALRAGCIVITTKLYDEPIINNSPIIQIDNWGMLKDIIDSVLINDLNNIEYFSGSSVANYITNIINHKLMVV